MADLGILAQDIALEGLSDDDLAKLKVRINERLEKVVEAKQNLEAGLKRIDAELNSRNK